MSKLQTTHTDLILLLLLLLLTALFRFGWVGTNSFSFDEARVSDLALRMAQQGDFAELGMQSSTGVPNFPAAVWLFALPYSLSTSPQLATHFVGLLNLLGVLALWWLGRATWGRWAGFTAAFLMSVAPFMVFYSRSIWSQNLLAPLAIFWALTAVLALRNIPFPSQWQFEPRWHGWLPALALLTHTFLSGFIFQVHPAGIGLTLGSLWLGFRFRLWHRWLPVVVGILLGTLSAAPALWTIARDGAGAQAELQELLDAPAQLTAVGFSQLGQLATAHGWETYWLGQSWHWLEPLYFLLPLSTLTLALLALGGLLLLLTRLIQDLRHGRATHTPSATTVLNALVPVWALVSPLFFLRSSTPVYIQYQLASAPALFLAMGAFVAWLVARWEQLRWPTAVSLTLIVLSHIAALTITLNTVSQTLTPGGMGTPLSYPQDLANILKNRGEPIVVHAIGDTVEFDGDAAIFRVLLWDAPHQIADGRHVLLLPSAGGTLLFPAENVPAWAQFQALQLPGSEIQHHFQRRINDLPFIVHFMPRLTSRDLLTDRFTPLDPPISLANGATLHGWRTTTQEDGRVQLMTLWRIDQLPPAGQFQQFNHLYLPESTAPDQVRDATTSSHAWREGDWLITWADFNAPEQPIARFDVGMYTWPELQRSPVHGRGPNQDPLAPIQLIPPTN